MTGLFAAVAVAVGGGLGAAARYALDTVVTVWIADRARSTGRPASRFPWGITLVNLSGSLLIGVLIGLGADHAGSGTLWWPALGIGVLGGYTTFSTASLDTARLLRERRYGLALVNAFGTLVAAVLLAGVGAWLGHLFVQVPDL